MQVLRNLIRYIRPNVSWLLPADENIWFHRQVAYQMLFWTMVHTTAHYVNFINVSTSWSLRVFETQHPSCSRRQRCPIRTCVAG